MTMPLIEINVAFHDATDALADISGVMPRMSELATQWSCRLRRFIAVAAEAEPGMLWQLGVAVSRSADALADLCQQTHARCGAARQALVAVRRGCRDAGGDPQAGVTIGAACATASAQLDLLEALVDQARRRFAVEQESLLELAIRHDTPPEWRAMAQATISRARGG